MEGVKLKEHEHVPADEPHAASAHLLKHWSIIQCLHNSAPSSSSAVTEGSLWTLEIISLDFRSHPTGWKSLFMILHITNEPEDEQSCITKLTSEHPYLPAAPPPAVAPPRPLFSRRISRSICSSSLLQNQQTALKKRVWCWRTQRFFPLSTDDRGG